MHDVFISYSTKNEKYTFEICRRIEEKGIKCWYAPRNIPPGELWNVAIADAIQSSKVFILIFSEDSNLSGQVLREVSLAADASCVIIPFRIDDSAMSSGLSYFLKTVQWFDASAKPIEHSISSLVETVCSKLEAVKSKEADEIEKISEEKSVEEKTDAVTIEDSTEPEQSLSDEDDEDDEYDEAKVKRLKRKILMYTILLILSIAVIVACSISLVKDVIDYINYVPEIELRNISSYKDCRYTFSGFAMFSNDRDMFLTEDIKEKDLNLVKTDTLLNIEDIDYSYDSAKTVSICANKNSNIIYFIDGLKNTVRIYDYMKGEWLVKDDISLRIEESEDVGGYIFTSPTINGSGSENDELCAMIYDYRDEVACFTKMIRITTEGEYRVKDISSFRLKDMICGSNSGDAIFMWDKNDKIKVFDVAKGTVPDISYEEMKEKYFPYITGGSNVLSPDKKYLCRTEDSVSVTNISVCELETGKIVFKKSLSGSGRAFFSKDGNLLYHDVHNFTLTSYNIEKNESTVILDAEYFLVKEKKTLNSPVCFYYSDKLDICFYGVSTDMDNWNKFRLVAIDTKGNILAKSDDIELGFKGYPGRMDITVKDENIFYKISSLSAFDEVKDNVNTVIYHGRYQKNKDGEVEFLWY